MRFGEAFKHNLVKPFEGRASRSEYWWFVLWYVIIFVVPYFLLVSTMLGFAATTSSGENFDPTGFESVFAGVGIIAFPLLMAWMFLLFWMMTAMFCTGMRRLHDTNRSAWWYLIVIIPLIGPITLLVFYCLPGTAGPNRFGEDPLQPTDPNVFR